MEPIEVRRINMVETGKDDYKLANHEELLSNHYIKLEEPINMQLLVEIINGETELPLTQVDYYYEALSLWLYSYEQFSKVKVREIIARMDELRTIVGRTYFVLSVREYITSEEFSKKVNDRQEFEVIKQIDTDELANDIKIIRDASDKLCGIIGELYE